MSEYTRVSCRIRPKEAGTSALKVVDKSIEITASSGATPGVFTFDAVFGASAGQAAVYEDVARRAVDGVLEGINGTVFAYGQTGSGKTHTMVGPSEMDDPSADADNWGIIPRAVDQIFSSLEAKQLKLTDDAFKFNVSAHYVQLYNEGWYDLLGSNRKLTLRSNGLDATKKSVSSLVDVLEVVSAGWKARRTAETNMNRSSSRSHCIFVIEVTTEELVDELSQRRIARLNLVDLAGSERVAHTGSLAGSEQFREGCAINSSLLMLKKVIRQLADRQFAQFRDSQLTLFLRDSIGGNARTSVVVTVHPDIGFLTDTTSTLQFAQQCRRIKNAINVNVKITGESILALNNKVNKLNQELACARASIREEMETQFAPIREELCKWREMYTHKANELEMLRLKDRLDRERGVFSHDGPVSTDAMDERYHQLFNENRRALSDVSAEELREQVEKLLHEKSILELKIQSMKTQSPHISRTPSQMRTPLIEKCEKQSPSPGRHTSSKKRRTTMFASSDVVRHSIARRLEFGSPENDIPEHLRVAEQNGASMDEEMSENAQKLIDPELNENVLQQLLDQRDRELVEKTEAYNAEIQRLTESIDKEQARCDVLNRNCAQLEDDLRRKVELVQFLSEKDARQQDTINELRSRQKSNEERCEAMSRDCDEMRRVVDDLEARIRQREERVEQLEGELERATAEKNGLISDKNTVELAKADVEKSSANLHAALSQARENNDRLEEQLNALRVEREKCASETDYFKRLLDDKMSEFEDQIETRNVRIQRLEADVAKGAEQAQLRLAEQRQMDAELLQKRTNQLRSENEAVVEKLRKAEIRHNEELDVWRAKLDDCNKEHVKTTHRMTIDNVERIRILEECSESLRTEVEILEQKLVETANERDTLRERVDEEAETISLLKKQLADVEDDREARSQQLSELAGHANQHQKVKVVSNLLREKVELKAQVLEYQTALGVANRNLSAAGLAQVQVQMTLAANTRLRSRDPSPVSAAAAPRAQSQRPLRGRPASTSVCEPQPSVSSDPPTKPRRTRAASKAT